MKVRNIVRKAAVLGSSAVLMGTTLMGALAYDLGTYPAKFIADGQFDGKIVVGEHAATADVLGSIDIASSLQAASVVKVPIAGQAGSSSFSGDAFELSSASDKVELREAIGDVVDTITEGDLEGLKSGRITTSEGDTEYSQYLRVKDAATLQEMTVNYVENDDDVLADYLVVDTGLPFLEWEIQFPEGAESEVESGSLEDLEDRSFNIMGTDFSIVQATISSGDDIELVLMGGSVADTLREGETRSYSISGVDYEVTLVFVSDPNTGTTEAKFSVNGELTQALAEGDTDTLSGGLQIGVRDVLVNSREGVASFFLGADKVVFTDTTTSTETFNGDVEINNENINDGAVAIQGQNVSGATSFEITSIKYQLTMDAEDGTTAYIPAGKGIKEFMKKPESLISDSLDIKYAGLVEVETSPFSISANGDDEYEVTFTNLQGQEYTFPYLSNKNGVFALGDEDDDLIFFEGSTNTSIGRDDYFVVTSNNDADKSVTNILQYTDYDDDQHSVEFEDQATGNSVSVAIGTSTGSGSLVIGGHSYEVNVSDVSGTEPTLYVDLNGDGDSGDLVALTTWGGVQIDLFNATSIGTNATVNGVNKTVGVGNGKILSSASATSDSVTLRARVLADNFDTSDEGEELFTWTVSPATSNQIDLSFSDTNYAGPLEDDVTGEAGDFQFRELESDDDYSVGMTDFGIFVKLYSPSGSNDPDELTLEIPDQQRTAQVFVTLGSVTQVQGGAGEADQINPIAVGLAVLDRDAPAVGTENLIVVGGPCANTVAAELLGNPAVCAEGFEAGKAVIQAWDKGSSVAILVAGYEAMETQGASRVLAAYKDYALSGSEVEVVVADLNSISVNPMS